MPFLLSPETRQLLVGPQDSACLLHRMLLNAHEVLLHTGRSTQELGQSLVHRHKPCGSLTPPILAHGSLAQIVTRHQSDIRVKAQEGGLRIYSRLPRKLAGKNNHNDTQVHLKEPKKSIPLRHSLRPNRRCHVYIAQKPKLQSLISASSAGQTRCLDTN